MKREREREDHLGRIGGEVERTLLMSMKGERRKGGC